MPGRSALDDPLKVHNYLVEVEGFVRAGFSEATGLEATTEVVEYREGGQNNTVQKSAGLTSYGNIILKRGQVIGGVSGGDSDFLNWAQEIHAVNAKGAPLEYRRTLDIIQVHRNQGEAIRWRVYEAWPTRFKPGSDLNATANEDSIEELELANEGFEPIK